MEKHLGGNLSGGALCPVLLAIRPDNKDGGWTNHFQMFHKFLIQRVIGCNIGAKQLQGPKDRVCYHHLGPQQKIQILRLKLWARVRTYNTATTKWGMKTIVCPVEDIDYWHIRMHFLEK